MQSTSGSADYIGAAPPSDLLQGRLSRASDVGFAIERTDLRWRLDVIMALEDYLN
jgi:hypothetical protein